MPHTAKLIFSVETVGHDFDSFDDLTKDVLACSLHERCDGSIFKRNGIGRSQLADLPLMGEIVSIGVYDLSRENGAVYFKGDEGMSEEQMEGEMKLKPLKSEKEILEHFWSVAGHYTEFISFNGDRKDVPFIMVRSAVHGVRATKDLMSARKLNEQRFDAVHVDIREQMTFYGALEQPGELHVWCNAFGIKSPATAEVTDVDAAFDEKRYRDVALRTVANMKAIHDLYVRWDSTLRF